MQNSNLLNSLLGATSATGGASGKAAASRAHAEAGTQFQVAMEQARPEVAARKPEAKRPENRPQAARQAEAAKADDSRTDRSRIDRPAADPARTAKSRADDARADKPQERQLKHTDSSCRVQANNDKAQAQDASAQSATAEDSVASDVPSGQVDEPANTALASVDAVDESLAAGLLEGLAGDTQDEQAPVDGLQPGVVQTDPGQEAIAAAMALAMATTSPLAGAQSDVDKAGEQASPSGLLEGVEQAIAALAGAVAEADASTANPGAANPALAVGGALAVGQNPAASSATHKAPASANTGQLLAELTLDPAATLETEAAAESAAATDTSGDLPEAGLLNTKTAFTKALENSLVSLDKPLATDTAKPAATALGPLEALARVAEAQAPGARAFTPQTSLAQGFGHPQWNQALGERVLWLAAQNLSAADIRLDPPELGSLQVRVSVNQEQASVSFVSPNPQVREALDQQATRLREMFAEQGLNLVNVDVSERHAREQHANEREGNGKRGAQADDEDLQVIGQSAPQSLRLVDHYA